jgi:hypothetical protein
MVYIGPLFLPGFCKRYVDFLRSLENQVRPAYRGAFRGLVIGGTGGVGDNKTFSSLLMAPFGNHIHIYSFHSLLFDFPGN